MSDWMFYGIAAVIGFVGALVSQVLTLQRSAQIKTQMGNLEKKKLYCDTVITRLNQQLDDVQNHAWELEKKIAESKNTAADKTESEFREFHKDAMKQRKEVLAAIDSWAKQRGEIINELCSAQQVNFVSPGSLVVLNIVAGTLVAWLFGFIEVLTRGSGQAILTLNLIIEFLFAGAFWPLIWERVFNTGAVQERVTAAAARFGVETTPLPASAGTGAPAGK